MRVYLVAGSPSGMPPAGMAPGPADRVIAVDYGAHHARAWGWPIHLLIGDLDSLPAQEAQALRSADTPVIRAPSAKDETDLELALERACQEGPDEIVICAALGGRADHMLANALLLARPDLAGRDVVIAEGSTRLRALHGGRNPWGSRQPPEYSAGLTLVGARGDLLSLLPVGGDAEGVTTEGLAYPLHGETLFLGQARGISNVFEEETARIWLRSGVLLVVHTHTDGQQPPLP